MARQVGISRRQFLVRGLAGAAGLAIVSACGVGGAPRQTGPGTAQGGQVTIRFLTTESDPPSQKVYDQAAADFSAQNPNIKIQPEYVGFDDRTAKIVAGIGAKKAPHISQLRDYEAMEYRRLGYMASLEDLIQETGGPDKWQPGSLSGVLHEGKYYAVPYNGGSYRTLWYRSDLYQQAGLQPPKTLDEWKQQAQALTKDTNGDGTVDLYGLALPGGKNQWTMGRYMNYLWQNGETVFDENFNVIFGKEGAVRTLQWYKEMVKFGPPGFANYSYNETIDAFVTGKVATQPYAGRTLTRVADNAPNLLSVVRGAKQPVGSVGGDVGYIGFDMYGVFNEKVGVTAAEQEAAKKFLQHILTGKPATDFALTVPGHLIPPYLETLEDENFWNGSPLMKSHKAEMDWLFNTENSLTYSTEAGAKITAEKVTRGPFNPYWVAVANAQIVETMVQRAIVQNEDPKAAVEWAAGEMKRVVEDARKKSKT